MLVFEPKLNCINSNICHWVSVLFLHRNGFVVKRQTKLIKVDLSVVDKPTLITTDVLNKFCGTTWATKSKCALKFELKEFGPFPSPTTWRIQAFKKLTRMQRLQMQQLPLPSIHDLEVEWQHQAWFILSLVTLATHHLHHHHLHHPPPQVQVVQGDHGDCCCSVVAGFGSGTMIWVSVWPLNCNSALNWPRSSVLIFNLEWAIVFVFIVIVGMAGNSTVVKSQDKKDEPLRAELMLWGVLFGACVLDDNDNWFDLTWLTCLN